jgi:hypothetical protein
MKSTFGPYGRAVTLRQIVPGAYDNSSGDTATAVTTDYTGVGRIGTYSDKLVDGTQIQSSDRLVTFVPDDLTLRPVEGSLIIAGTDIYTVVNFKTRELGGETICFSLQVRVI